MHLTGTIVALSSGRPPSAVAVIRVSGPDAGTVANAFGATALPPRRAVLRTLRSPHDGERLDRALCLWFPGPASATGEDVVELHCHGGPALVDRLLSGAMAVPGVRMAEPGEFTMRAVLSGRMDLPAAEALADLVEARSEAERRRASRLAGGALSRRVADWRAGLIGLLADAEARLDFADEADVPSDVGGLGARCRALAAVIDVVLAGSADSDRLTDGFHIVLVGPPNAGKSSLLNALAGTDAAIVSDEAGTTRDVVSVPLQLAGYRVTLHDTAGLREDASGVEALGIARTRDRAATADLVVEVRSPDTCPLDGRADLVVAHKSDLGGTGTGTGFATSLADPASIARLRTALAECAADGLRASEAALVTRSRQSSALRDVVAALEAAAAESALELQAEALRLACHAMARMTGEIGIEDVLDDVFGRFCIGK